MAGAIKSVQRLRTILDRQEKPAWGPKYQPAIRATRAEAPRISRPTILHPRKLGRDMHLLSDPETFFALLALFHPAVFDIHEQHVISMLPALHPLATHPESSTLRLPDLPGTIAVAESMNCLARHPKIFVDNLPDPKDTSTGNSGAWAPWPFIGDLLIFLRDGRGPYCVNWTVKLDSKEFRSRRLLPGMRRYKARTEEDDVRHLFEAAHFASGQIRTVQLARPDISTQLVLNLRELHGWDARTYQLNESIRERVTLRMREIVGTPTIAFHEIRALSEREGCSCEDVKAITHSAIWRREIRVDLFRPLLVDRPLRPEIIDPMAKYAVWFER